jgi:hypothetical protein
MAKKNKKTKVGKKKKEEKDINKIKNPDVVAKVYVNDYLGAKDANVKRIPIPKKFIDMTEKKLRKKFDKKPYAYVYYPKRGKTLDRKKIHGWEGCATHTTDVKLEDGGYVFKPKRGYIFMPNLHLKDDDVKNVVLVHELGEILSIQEKLKEPTTHQKALKVERKYKRKRGIDRPSVFKRMSTLYENKKGWK